MNTLPLTLQLKQKMLAKAKGLGSSSTPPPKSPKNLMQTLMDLHEGQEQGTEHGTDAEVTVNILTQSVIPQQE